MAIPDSINHFSETQLNNEEWRDVVGYEGLYKVSNLGRVKSFKKCNRFPIPRILKPHPKKEGYFDITLRIQGKPKSHYIHILVAFAFLGSPPTPKHEINHINRIRNDNRLSNLEWLTHSENQKHSAKLGRKFIRGEEHTLSKLTRGQVFEIKRLYKEGYLQREIAVMFGIARQTVSDILRQKRWAWL